MKKSIHSSAFLILCLMFLFSQAFPQRAVFKTGEQAKTEAVVYVRSGLSEEQMTSPQSVQSEEAAAQETYTSQVILQAHWGEQSLYDRIYGWYAGKEESKPGEFGFEITGEGPPIGPNSFTVAPNGDVYINDPLNKRIQRFGPNGEFICVIRVAPFMGGPLCADKDDNIYIYAAQGILKYDQAGNLLASYPIDVGKKRISPTETESRGLAGLYCDNEGRVFISFHYDFRRLDRATQAFIDTGWGGICQVGDAARAFSLEEQKSYVTREGFLGANSSALDQGYFIGGQGMLHLIGFQGDTIRTFKSVQGSFLGCDEQGNIYSQQLNLHIYGNEDSETKAPLVRKTNVRDELIASFKYWCDKPYYGSSTFLDNKGNLYLLCQSLEDGLRVIKWHKSD